MNKYLEKIAAKLSASTKHWVKERIKVDVPAMARSVKGTPESFKEKGRQTYKVMSKTNRTISKITPLPHKSEEYRGQAIIDRVVGRSIK